MSNANGHVEPCRNTHNPLGAIMPVLRREKDESVVRCLHCKVEIRGHDIREAITGWNNMQEAISL